MGLMLESAASRLACVSSCLDYERASLPADADVFGLRQKLQSLQQLSLMIQLTLQQDLKRRSEAEVVAAADFDGPFLLRPQLSSPLLPQACLSRAGLGVYPSRAELGARLHLEGANPLDPDFGLTRTQNAREG